MSIYKTPHGYKLDFRAQRAGEDFRITRIFDLKTQAQSAEAVLKVQLKLSRARAHSMPDPLMSFDQVLAQWLKESDADTLSARRIKNKVNAGDYREKSRIKKWRGSRLAQIPFIDLSIIHIEGWIDDRRLPKKHSIQEYATPLLTQPRTAAVTATLRPVLCVS